MIPEDVTRIGHLLSPHGVRGAIKLFVIGEPAQLLKLQRLYVETLGWRKVQGLQMMGPGLVVQLAGVSDRTAAEGLQGLQVYAHDRELPALPEGEYYYHELRGLSVEDDAGTRLGEVVDVQDAGHQDLLVVQHPGGESLVPLQAPYVIVKRGLCVVLRDAPEGLLGEGAEVVEGEQP
ncbi:ribosome maturation factor RimM [Deinococcus sonorensis]|uniref:Ribosome maturation factor RimM n=2 Tax=Deinococcus sonorensis TaxID=309891 RepID=A0AAU7UAM3_9DEIO